jgi:ankyrin repeat protein
MNGDEDTDILANEDDLDGNSVEALQASWLERVDGLRTYLVSPVHDAAAKGNVARLQELVGEGVNVNEVDKVKNSPLVGELIFPLTFQHYAAGAGHTAAVKFLLDNQANPNAQNLLGDTPLHRVATDNSPSTL